MIRKRPYTTRGIVMKAANVSPVFWQVGLLYSRDSVYCKIGSAVRIDAQSVAGTAKLGGVTRTTHIAIRLRGSFGSVLKVIAAETLVCIFDSCHTEPKSCTIADAPLDSHVVGVLNLIGENSAVGVVYPASFIVPSVR